jgi:hypothetical protein
MAARGINDPDIGTSSRRRLQTLDRSTGVLETVVQSGGMSQIRPAS